MLAGSSQPTDALGTARGIAIAELERALARHARGRGMPTAVPRQYLTREDGSPESVDLAYRPMLCFVVRGAKRAVAGTRRSRVESGQMFASLLEVPVVADYESPFLSVTLDIDDGLLAAIVAEIGDAVGPAPVPGSADLAMTRAAPPVEGFVTAVMDPRLIDAVVRWVRLLDEPEHIAMLAPRAEQEILYRALRSPLGAALRRAVASGPLADIRRAAAMLSDRAADPLSVPDLARLSGMSEATFYRHFRAATGSSPVRFQKTVRLQAARRLLAAGSHTASAAATAVGYVSAAQFGRDYRRQYGVPPAQDADRLRSGGFP